MKGFMNHGSQIVHIAHEIVVLDARPSDADCVDFLKSISANQMRRHLPGDHDDGRRVHVGVGIPVIAISGAWADVTSATPTRPDARA